MGHILQRRALRYLHKAYTGWCCQQSWSSAWSKCWYLYGRTKIPVVAMHTNRWTRQRRSSQDAIGTNKKESFSAGAPWNVFGTTIGKKDFSRCHRQNTLPSKQSPKQHWWEGKESHRGMPTLLSVAWQALQKHKNVSTIMTNKDWIDIIRRVNSSWPPRAS
jgi:hypothetical protein